MEAIRGSPGPSGAASVSLTDLPDRERHFQKRVLELAMLLRVELVVSCLSAQNPSGNQTYSYPSRGGRGGSTPNFEEVDTELTLGLCCGDGLGELGFEKAPSCIARS
ncbi:hypothetical protein V8C44DRAFT_355873 [Trichoderma aethiopicum]